MQDPRDAEDAVKALDGTELCGMRAHVEMAKAKEERRRDAQERQLREEMEKRKRRIEERRREEERKGGRRRRSRSRTPTRVRSRSRGYGSEKGHSSSSRSKSRDYRRDARDYKSEPKEYEHKRRALEKKGHDRKHDGEYKSRSHKLKKEHSARLPQEEINRKEESRKETRSFSSTSKDDKRKGKTSSIGENYGKSCQRERSHARNSKEIVSKKVKVKDDKKVKKEVGSGREEGELESSEEEDDEDPYADQTKFR